MKCSEGLTSDREYTTVQYNNAKKCNTGNMRPLEFHAGLSTADFSGVGPSAKDKDPYFFLTIVNDHRK